MCKELFFFFTDGKDIREKRDRQVRIYERKERMSERRGWNEVKVKRPGN